jgi:methylenetetrahydrofolate reductase (NADPH)
MLVDRGTLKRLLDHTYLEVIPAPSILERLACLPRNAYLSITCSPRHGLEPTLKLVEQIQSLPQDRLIRPVPHIAARLVRDRGHLEEVLARLREAQVKCIFVPAGDPSTPVGIYDDSLMMLRDMAEIGHSMEDVGVAAHPEGHPFLSDQELLRFLKEKQRFATYMVTQMCFDPNAIIGWLRDIRNAGVTLPTWIGLPGVADVTRLISVSLRIGVGQSVRFLKKQTGLLRKLIGAKSYQPDSLLGEIAPYIDDPALNISGFHLFSFNDVERTEKWRVEACNNLRR